MDENPRRRRQRAYRMLREMPHATPKAEAIRILDEARCFDYDIHKEQQYEKFVNGFHKICRRTDDVQMDMIPLWRMVDNGDGTFTKLHYLGKFGEMDAGEHYQHIDARRDGVWDDCEALYHYLDRIEEPKRHQVQLRLEFDGKKMPPRPPESRPNEDLGDDNDDD